MRIQKLANPKPHSCMLTPPVCKNMHSNRWYTEDKLFNAISGICWYWCFSQISLKLAIRLLTSLLPSVCQCIWTNYKLYFSYMNRDCRLSAVYTGIKKNESFSHSGFSLKVARQLPLNTKKKTNRKTHLHSVIFWNSAQISLVFCQCKRSLQSRRYYSGFWSRATWPSAESPDRGPRRNAHYTCTVKGREKSRMHTTYQNTSMRFRFFRACAFCAKNPECYGFFWQCKRYNKKPRFFGFWFLPM